MAADVGGAARGTEGAVNDIAETHAVLTARHQLREVADAYQALAEIALNGPDPNALRDQRRSSRELPPDPDATGSDGRRLGDVTDKFTAGTTPVHLPTLDARLRIDRWANELTDAVHAYRNANGQPWASRSIATPALLREIADDHLGVFLAGDPMESEKFLKQCLDEVKHARRTTFGLEGRWMRLNIPCAETLIDEDEPDAGRVLCPGEYRMWMKSGEKGLGDMVCDADPEHRLTPAQWFGAKHRKPQWNNAAVANLARTLRLVGGA